MNIQDYLGDGLYVSYDGHQIALKANHHETPTDVVYLEPEVFMAFLRFASRVLNVEIKVIKHVK